MNSIFDGLINGLMDQSISDLLMNALANRATNRLQANKLNDQQMERKLGGQSVDVGQAIRWTLRETDGQK